jgi:hypothetical protein
MKKYSYLILLCIFFISSCKNVEELIRPPVAQEATDVCSEGFTAKWESEIDYKKFLLYVSLDADFDTYLPGYNGKEVEGYSHRVKGLNHDLIYYYKIRAKYHEEHSEFSNIIEVRTPKECLSAPVKLKAKDVEYDRFTVHWKAVDGAEKYIVEVAHDKEFKNHVRGYEKIVTKELYQQIYPLHEKTTYYYRVRAVKGNSWSCYSEVNKCKTPLNRFLLKKVELKGLTNFSPDYEITVTYNDKHQVTEMIRDRVNNRHKNTYRYYYDNKDRLIKIEIRSAVHSHSGPYVFEFTYDDKSRVLQKKEYFQPDNQPKRHIGITTYKYEDNDQIIKSYEEGRIVGIDENLKFIKDKHGNITYSYWELLHLNGSKTIREREYTYENKRFPKGFDFMFHLEDNQGQLVTESHFPIWIKQTKLVKEITFTSRYIRDEINGEDDTHYYKTYYEYQYNEHDLPVYRKAIGDGYQYEMYFYYEEIVEEHISSR